MAWLGLKKSPSAYGSYERFINSGDHMPILVKCALAHAQFETIHPFLDGNGRLGRFLITSMLCESKVLKRPLLYLSLFLERNAVNTMTGSMPCVPTVTSKAGLSHS